MKAKKLKLTYRDIDSCARRIAFRMNKRNVGANIVTFTKGGLFSTGFICNHLNWKPVVLSVDHPSSIDVAFIKNHGENLILVDDILDTGKTYKEFIDWIPMRHPFGYFLADKPNKGRIYTPKEYYSPYLVEDEAWVTFPWETSLS